MLSAEERRTRAAIAVKTRFGLDTGPDRDVFLKLQAERQLGEVAARLVEARSQQGFPDRVTDAAAVLAETAGLLLADAVRAGRLAPAPNPASLVRIAAAIKSVTVSPTNKTAEAAPASAIKEAIICAEPTDNDSSR